jgi:hypothetical protein
MNWISRRSMSLVAAMIIIVVSTTAAQGSSQGAGGQAAAQGPSNVNVVNVPTVTVGNTELQPIPVKEPLKEPVHANFSNTIALGLAAADLGTYAIPRKRLVIEHFAAHCHSTIQPAELILFLNNDQDALSFLPTKSIPFLFGSTRSAGAGPVMAYVDQGTIIVEAVRNTSLGTATCQATVLGYLTLLQ